MVTVAAPRRFVDGARDSIAAHERAAWRLLAEREPGRMRLAAKGDVREGRSASRGGMWAVERVLAVRRPARRWGRQLEARVRWARQWGSEQTQWVAVRQLNARAKADARRMEERVLGKRPRDEGAGEGAGGSRRRSPRLGGVQPAPGLLASPRRGHKRSRAGLPRGEEAGGTAT